MNELLPGENKNDAFARILRFMTDADITLLALEEKILNRWIYTDTLLRSRKFKEDDIINKIVAAHGVSKFTARNDIFQTQALFGAARKANKQYLLYHHAEDIALQIERSKSDKSLVPLLPKLYDAYTKAIAAMPEDANKNVLPPPVFIFNVVPGQNIEKKMSISEAREKAKLKLNAQNAEPIDFEDQPDES